MKQTRKPTLFEALLPIIFLIIILVLSLMIFHVDPQIPLLLATAFTSILGVYRLGHKWSDLEGTTPPKIHVPIRLPTISKIKIA